MILRKILLYLFSFLFIAIGINHFIHAHNFEKIIPPFLPCHRTAVYISGVIEIILGALLLFPKFRRYAAIGLVILLIVIFPANIYMYTSGKFTQFPQWALLMRLPLQLVLMFWAASYLRKSSSIS